MSKTEPSSGSLARRVTVFTAVCVLVSNMVGTGIFGTTGFMAADLGRPWLIFALWGAGALFALLGAVSYGELGASLPRAGGEYVYIRRAYGPLMGFLSGWASFTVGFAAAIALNAVLFGAYLRELWPALAAPEDGSGWQAVLAKTSAIELTVVWALTLVHLRGVGIGSLVQNGLTVVKIGGLLLLVLLAFALGEGDWSNLSRTDGSAFPEARTMLVSFMFVTFGYTGWNAAAYIAEELREPGRNLPRAMWTGTLAVAVIYVAMNVVYIYALPVTRLGEPDGIESVGAKTTAALFGDATGGWLNAFFCISIIGSASAMIWVGPRVYFAMARDGVFPRYFASTGEQSQVPARSIVLQSVWISLLILSGGFESLLAYASFVLVLFSAIAVGAVIVLRRREPELERPFRVPLYPWSSILFIAISIAILWAALQIRPTESMWGLATTVAGIPLYFLWRRRA